jgi:hypothetical protein
MNNRFRIRFLNNEGEEVPPELLEILQSFGIQASGHGARDYDRRQSDFGAGQFRMGSEQECLECDVAGICPIGQAVREKHTKKAMATSSAIDYEKLEKAMMRAAVAGAEREHQLKFYVRTSHYLGKLIVLVINIVVLAIELAVLLLREIAKTFASFAILIWMTDSIAEAWEKAPKDEYERLNCRQSLVQSFPWWQERLYLNTIFWVTDMYGTLRHPEKAAEIINFRHCNKKWLKVLFDVRFAAFVGDWIASWTRPGFVVRWIANWKNEPSSEEDED